MGPPFAPKCASQIRRVSNKIGGGGGREERRWRWRRRREKGRRGKGRGGRRMRREKDEKGGGNWENGGRGGISSLNKVKM